MPHVIAWTHRTASVSANRVACIWRSTPPCLFFGFYLPSVSGSLPHVCWGPVSDIVWHCTAQPASRVMWCVCSVRQMLRSHFFCVYLLTKHWLRHTRYINLTLQNLKMKHRNDCGFQCRCCRPLVVCCRYKKGGGLWRMNKCLAWWQAWYMVRVWALMKIVSQVGDISWTLSNKVENLYSNSKFLINRSTCCLHNACSHMNSIYTGWLKETFLDEFSDTVEPEHFFGNIRSYKQRQNDAVQIAAVAKKWLFSCPTQPRKKGGREVYLLGVLPASNLSHGVEGASIW